MKYFIATFCSLLLVFGIIASTPTALAQSSITLSGYAWSSNIGWISFSGSGYGVSLDLTTGLLTGSAWSDHIGWVQFGGLSSYPSGAGTVSGPATVNLSTGAVTGWARACSGTVNVSDPNSPGNCSSMTSRTDGADGWLSLSGTGYGVTYSPTNGIFSGFMWGDMTGWTSWSPTGNVPCNPAGEVCVTSTSTPPIVTLNANPTTVTSGQTTTLSWSASNNPTSCTLTSSAGLNQNVASTSAGMTSPSITTATTFALICTNNSGSGSANTLVNIGVTTSSTSTVSMWLNNDSGKSLSSIKIHPSGSVKLNWDTSGFVTTNSNAQCFEQTPTAAVPGVWANNNPLPTTSSPNDPSNPNVVIGSTLPIGTYKLDISCTGNDIVSGNPKSANSNFVMITITNSTIQEQ